MASLSVYSCIMSPFAWFFSTDVQHACSAQVCTVTRHCQVTQQLVMLNSCSLLSCVDFMRSHPQLTASLLSCMVLSYASLSVLGL